MSQELVILSPSTVRFGQYVIDVKDTTYKVLVKLRAAIIARPDRYIGMENIFRLLQGMNELGISQDNMEGLRLNLLIFLDAWWSNAPAAEIPEQLKPLAAQIEKSLNISPTVSGPIESSVLVRFPDGSIHLEPSMQNLRAKMQECVTMGRSVGECERTAVQSL